MKNIKLLIIAFLAISAATFTSCKQPSEDLAAPVISFDDGHGDKTFESGEALPGYYTVSGTVTALGGFQEMTFWKDGTTFETVTTFDSDTATTFSFKVMKEDLELEDGATDDKVLKFKVQVKDKQETPKTSEKAITITVKAAPAVTKTVGTYNVSLHSDNLTTANNTGAFNLATGSALNAYSGTASDMDLVYVYHGTTEHAIGSADAGQVSAVLNINNGVSYSTSDKSNTLIMTITQADYDNADVNYIENLTVTNNSTLTGAGGNGIDHINNATYFAFKTAGGKIGLAKVKTTDTKTTGTTTMDVKYVKDSSAK